MMKLDSVLTPNNKPKSGYIISANRVCVCRITILFVCKLSNRIRAHIKNTRVVPPLAKLSVSKAAATVDN